MMLEHEEASKARRERKGREAGEIEERDEACTLLAYHIQDHQTSQLPGASLGHPLIQPEGPGSVPIREQFEQAIQQAVGESDFTLMFALDYGHWLPLFGTKQRVLRWVLGNLLMAIAMIRGTGRQVRWAKRLPSFRFPLLVAE
jgi:hypothetical protein